MSKKPDKHKLKKDHDDSHVTRSNTVCKNSYKISKYDPEHQDSGLPDSMSVFSKFGSSHGKNERSTTPNPPAPSPYKHGKSESEKKSTSGSGRRRPPERGLKHRSVSSWHGCKYPKKKDTGLKETGML